MTPPGEWFARQSLKAKSVAFVQLNRNPSRMLLAVSAASSVSPWILAAKFEHPPDGNSKIVGDRLLIGPFRSKVSELKSKLDPFGYAMPLELWISFALASATILAVPGPTVMLVVSYALQRGRRSGLATVPGVILGDLTAMSISLAGAGAILITSATLFTILKLCGAAYLVWLGIKLWRAPVANPLDVDLGTDPVVAERGQWPLFWNSFVVTALNPKGIVFFVAFVPQFVDAGSALLPQFSILTATFVGLAGLNAAAWALAAGRLKATFRTPSMRRAVNRIGGACLCGAGALTAMARQ